MVDQIPLVTQFGKPQEASSYLRTLTELGKPILRREEFLGLDRLVGELIMGLIGHRGSVNLDEHREALDRHIRQINAAARVRQEGHFINGIRYTPDDMTELIERSPFEWVRSSHFLRSLLQQIRAGRVLTDKQVAALSPILKDIEDVSGLKVRQTRAESLLSEDEGYLATRYVAMLRDFVSGRARLTPEKLESIVVRVQEFKDAKIPPFYKHGLMFPKEQIIPPFPVVDYVVHQGCGNYAQMIRASAFYERQRLERRGVTNNLQRVLVVPVRPKQLLAYAAQAHDDGAINVQLLRDLIWSIRQHQGIDKEKKPKYEDITQIIVHYIHSILHPFIPKKTTYSQKFEPEQDISFVYGLPFWHLGYSPQDRVAIAEKFIGGLRSADREKFPRKEDTIQRMALLFPELPWPDRAVSELDDLRFYREEVRGIVNKCLETRNFERLPATVFYDPHYEQLRPQLLSALHDHFVHLEKEHLFGRKGFCPIGISASIGLIPEVDEVFQTARLEVVKKLNDQEFLMYFDGLHAHRFAVGGQRSLEDVSEICLAVHGYVMSRLRRLRG